MRRYVAFRVKRTSAGGWIGPVLAENDPRRNSLALVLSTAAFTGFYRRLRKLDTHS